MLCDAHNHLHFPAFSGETAQVVAAMRGAGIARCVVNGTSEADWPEVAALARTHPEMVLPAFGLHPWFLETRSPRWRVTLEGYLDEFPEASVGECGLDHGMPEADPDLQREIFVAQLTLAARKNRPVTVHCVKAWGGLLEILATGSVPGRGIVLHDFSGSAELVRQLAPHSVWFSFSAAALDPRREKLHEAFRAVPDDRLLLETDAPNRPPPEHLRKHPLGDPAAYHPADFLAVVTALAPLRDLPPETLSTSTTRNFHRVFLTDGAENEVSIA